MRRRQRSYRQPAITIIFPPPLVPCQTYTTGTGTDNLKNTKQLELVREEIRVSSLFSHPNLLPLLGHAIISVKYKLSGVMAKEAICFAARDFLQDKL
ncbi:hypothetical protein SO802_019376 [Lithocarpus litseifolius]|uniref:Uncharacterized protein n=1 Tax=Lithocarpus litseifolius TaxID=425828 RepID=A0AAW2CP04_9ROSI